MGKARIISYNEEPFNNRQEAAQLLAKELTKFRGKRRIDQCGFSS